MRLDRFLTQQTRLSKADVRQYLLSGRVRVGDAVCRDASLKIKPMMQILLDDRQLAGETPRYYMLHKPRGVVSATRDDEHPTVLSLLPESLQDGLHIAGRLDLNTTGLMLLTNDGRWSRRVTQPEVKIPKVYRVGTARPIESTYTETFRQGIYFAYEDLTTSQAELDILDTRLARLTIYEGRYHQVKRMFGHFRNQVLSLHREQIGPLALDADLAEGEYRALTEDEVALFSETSIAISAGKQLAETEG